VDESHFGAALLENGDLDISFGCGVGWGLICEQRDGGSSVNEGCGF
jgi:hypothetical protein